jgi:O-antigen/teichoic acid export membrane protein
MPKKNVTKSVVAHQAITTNVAARLVGMLFGFAFQVLVVKILVPGEFAIYALSFAALTIGAEVLSFGVGDTLIRFVPCYMVNGDLRGLKLLAERMIALRVASLFIVAMLLIVSVQFATPLLPSNFTLTTIFIFAVWLATSILYVDAFHLAQSLMAQRDAAMVTVSEAAIRFSAVCGFYLLRQSVDAELVIFISAATSTLSLVWLTYRLWGALKPPSGLAHENSVGRTFSFALGRYASATAWMISSPSVVRLVAAPGLSVLSLSAFSFVQGLYLSIQRAFPGLILLQSMEPILLAKLAQGARYEKILSSIAVVFKLELFFASSVFIASSLAGPAIITLLARPEYAPYWYILPILGIIQALNAAYRILEVVASAVAKQTIFFWLWPIGVISTACIYFTVHTWGIWAVLAFPLLEVTLRVSSLMIFFRRDGMQTALDIGRSTIMILSAAMIVAAAYFFVEHGQASLMGSLLIATIGIVAFLLVVCATRPLRPLEHQLVLAAIPQNWKAVRLFAGAITRH